MFGSQKFARFLCSEGERQGAASRIVSGVFEPKVVHELDEVQAKEMENYAIETQKIYWLFERLNLKIDRMSNLFLDLTYKTEFNLRQLWSKIIKSLSEDKIRFPPQYIAKIQYTIFRSKFDYDQRNKI